MSARPGTLLRAAMEQAERAHVARLRELQAIQPMLAELQRHVGELLERGLSITPDMLGMRQERLHARPGAYVHAVLRLRTRPLGDSAEEMTLDWWRALTRTLGFSVVNCDPQGLLWPTALLRRGALLLRTDMPRCVHARSAHVPVTPGMAWPPAAPAPDRAVELDAPAEATRLMPLEPLDAPLNGESAWMLCLHAERGVPALGASA